MIPAPKAAIWDMSTWDRPVYRWPAVADAGPADDSIAAGAGRRATLCDNGETGRREREGARGGLDQGRPKSSLKSRPSRP